MLKLDTPLKKSVLFIGLGVLVLTLTVLDDTEMAVKGVYTSLVALIAYAIGTCKTDGTDWLIERVHEYMAFTVSVLFTVIFIFGVISSFFS